MCCHTSDFLFTLRIVLFARLLATFKSLKEPVLNGVFYTIPVSGEHSSPVSATPRVMMMIVQKQSHLIHYAECFIAIRQNFGCIHNIKTQLCRPQDAPQSSTACRSLLNKAVILAFWGLLIPT